MLGLEGLKLHELRHTAGTLTAKTGATTRELMAHLGHSSPCAAMTDQHATSERDRRIAERPVEMFDPERGSASRTVGIVPDLDAPDQPPIPWGTWGARRPAGAAATGPRTARKAL